MSDATINSKTFSVKFKGQIYDDAHKLPDGHIFFGGNKFEYCPKTDLFADKMYIHSFVQKGNSWVRVSKQSQSRPVILDHIN